MCPFLSFHSTIEQSLAPHPCSEAFHQDPFVHSPTWNAGDRPVQLPEAKGRRGNWMKFRVKCWVSFWRWWVDDFPSCVGMSVVKDLLTDVCFEGFLKGRITMNHLDKTCYMNFIVKTLSETTTAPANQWLEDDFPFLGWPIFRCVLVSFRECIVSEMVILLDWLPFTLMGSRRRCSICGCWTRCCSKLFSATNRRRSQPHCEDGSEIGRSLPGIQALSKLIIYELMIWTIHVNPP